MLKLLEDPETLLHPKKRPSGHDIGARFSGDNGGAIPSNLLEIPNTESNSPILRCASWRRPRAPRAVPGTAAGILHQLLDGPR